MTRKHYVLLAAAIKGARMPSNDDRSADYNRGIDQVAWDIADALAADNRAFDKGRFLKTAGCQ